MTTTETVELLIITFVVAAIVGFYLYKIIKNKWLNQILDTIKNAMVEAEERWPQGHGDEKREYVLQAIEEKCKELDIPYGLIVASVTKLIAEIVEHWNFLKK